MATYYLMMASQNPNRKDGKMEKLIKITARMIDGSKEKYRTTSFEVKPFRNGERLYIKLDDNYTFVCKSIQVEQKQVDFALTCLSID